MNELVVIDPKQYGLEQTKADEIAEAFREPLAELVELETEYKNFENLTGEPPKSTCAEAKVLQQRYVKNRKAREGIHKTEKSYFLNAGRYVDAWKNKSLEVSKEREDNLKEIADYHINIEKKRVIKLGQERETDLLKYQDPEMTYIPPELGKMEIQAWEIYISGIKKDYEEKQEAAKKAEAERIEAEKAEKAEQERIRQENEKLKAEAEVKEKALAKERKAREAKEEKERIERERIEAEKQIALDAERLEQEKKIAVERAEREKLEQEKRDREEAERKAQEEKDLAEKKAAVAPDKEKVQQIIDYVSAFPLVKVKTAEAQAIIEYAESQMRELCKWLFSEMQDL